MYNHQNQECLELKPAMVGAMSDPTAQQKVSALLVYLQSHCSLTKANEQYCKKAGEKFGGVWLDVMPSGMIFSPS